MNGSESQCFYLNSLDNNFGHFHTAKAQPSGTCQSHSSVQPLAASPSFHSHTRQVSGPCFGTSGRDISSLSTQAMCGAIILLWPFHLWPPMGSSSWLGQIGSSKGQQSLSPFLIICPAVDSLPLTDLSEEQWRNSMLMAWTCKQSFSERRLCANNTTGY